MENSWLATGDPWAIGAVIHVPVHAGIGLGALQPKSAVRIRGIGGLGGRFSFFFSKICKINIFKFQIMYFENLRWKMKSFILKNSKNLGFF